MISKNRKYLCKPYDFKILGKHTIVKDYYHFISKK